MVSGRVTIRHIHRPGKLDQYGKISWVLRGTDISAFFERKTRRVRQLDGDSSDVAGTLEVGSDVEVSQHDVLVFTDSKDQFEVFSVDRNPGADGKVKQQLVKLVQRTRRVAF